MTITVRTQTGKTGKTYEVPLVACAKSLAVQPVSVSCSACQLTVINGHACHELGCPEAWRDERRLCKWCGAAFNPAEKHSTCCSPCCAASYADVPCTCPDCRESTDAE